MRTSAVPAVRLNDGVEMPLLGFGVFQISDTEECERSVVEAIHTGYRLIDTAAAYGVQIESWGPFAEGRNNIFENALLRALADKHQKTVAQIILRWPTQRGVVAIPKSVRKERIVENFSVFDFELSPEELATIATLDTKTSSFFDHRDPKIVKMLGEAKRPT